ncbi:MAG TPA: T9SS type A sorting domain-containing protein [Puia sp.]|nr:T9SS type A sorting domain-containing protein [Puia sp.]
MKTVILHRLKSSLSRLCLMTGPIFLNLCSYANTNTAVATGNWESASTWSRGAVPTTSDDVVIPSGLTVTLTATGDVCGAVTINSGGTLTINSNESLAIGGNFTNAGSFTASSGSTLTFNCAANTVISGGGTYLIAGTVVLNMATTATALDVQDANFATGVNNGSNDYFTLIRGTFKMDNSGSLYMYNSGSANSLTIPYGVTIESDAGLLYLAPAGTTNNVILSGKLFINGGSVNVQMGQSLNSGEDFQYTVNGGTPQLYVSSGSLNIGAGFNALNSTDYIDFEMTGGRILLACNGYSNWITFQLADNVGGKTVMSAGLIILQNACNNNIEDIDMGGSNVAATLYSVTGGTVQFGYAATQATSTYFGIDGQPATNYPNLDFEPGTAKDAASFNGKSVNMLSLHINPNQTFDATNFPVVNILKNNGTYAFDQEGTFKAGNNTVEFSGDVPQKISTSSLASLSFHNLTIANTAGNVYLGVPVTVTNQLSFTSGKIDATTHSLTVSNGSVPITGASSSSYVIAGTGVSPNTGQLVIAGLPSNSGTLFPMGTASYYLPAIVNPGANTGTSYSAFVFQDATSNASADGPAFSPVYLQQMVNAVWSIGQAAGSGSATLTLNWLASGTALEGSTFQLAGTSIGISRYTGSAGNWAAATGTGDVSTATATSSFSSWTQFTVTMNSVVLSNILLDFGAQLRDDRTVGVSWSVADETGVARYVVQRSVKAGDWETIATARPRDEGPVDQRYALVDKSPVDGVNDYRLLIEKRDGSSAYSSVRAVPVTTRAGVSIYPNPATDEIHIQTGAGNEVRTVVLLDANGKVLQRLDGSGPAILSLPVKAYPAGTYYIELAGADGTRKITTLLIRH